MKKLSLLVVAATMSLMGLAQDFESIMNENIQRLEQKTEKVDYAKLSVVFETLAEKNPERFEAKYYQAFCLIENAYNTKGTSEKDTQLIKAESIINKAIEQDKANAELYILKAMCYQMMIDVNPQKRGYLYSQKAAKELALALEIDKKNPRYYFLKGQNVFYTPEQFGGGKAKAKPYFEKANKSYKSEKRKNKLDPIWGQKTNAQQLEVCKK